jgi:hypothetical protein
MMILGVSMIGLRHAPRDPPVGDVVRRQDQAHRCEAGGLIRRDRASTINPPSLMTNIAFVPSWDTKEHAPKKLHIDEQMMNCFSVR